MAKLFLAFAPVLGWRHIVVTEHRTRVDWAYFMRDLADVSFPAAERIRVVLDNLNVHIRAALYEAFPPDEARRILRRLNCTTRPSTAVG